MSIKLNLNVTNTGFVLNANEVLPQLKLPHPEEASKTHNLFSRIKDKLSQSSSTTIHYQSINQKTGQVDNVSVSIIGERRQIKAIKQMMKGDRIGELAKAVNQVIENKFSPPKAQKTKPQASPTPLAAPKTEPKAPPVAPRAPAAAQSPPADHSNLKRAVIDMMLSNRQASDMEPLSAAIARSGLSDAMNIHQLIAELPSLYPGKPPSELANIRQGLMTQWMSLEAGHEWGIGLKYSTGGKTENTSGNYPVITNGKAAILVADFMKAEGGNIRLSQEGQEKVRQAALSGAKAAQNTDANYRKNNYDLSNPGANLSTGAELRRELDANGIVNIPTGWAGHAVGMTLHKAADGKYFLYYCNRGGQAFEKAEDRALMGGQQAGSFNMVCYEIGNPAALTPELLGQIVGCLQHSQDPQVKDAFAKPFIEGKSGIMEILNLKKAAEIPKTPQKTGNCAWANCKGSVHASIIAAAYDDLVKAAPGGTSEQHLSQAIHTGGTIFKKMERSGRKQSLDPLLKYNGLSPDATVSPFDHMRVLSAAGRKLTQKANEARNSSETRTEDQRMSDQVAAQLNQSPYPIGTIGHFNLGPGSREILQQNLRAAGNGSYAFVDNQCWICVNGQVNNLGTVNTNQPLGQFLKQVQAQHPSLQLTLPVMLEQRTFTPTQDSAYFCKSQINHSRDQIRNLNKTHDERTLPIKRSIMHYENLLKNPSTPADQRTVASEQLQRFNGELARMEAEFQQNKAVLRGHYSQSLQAVTMIPDGNPPSQELAQLKSAAAALAQKALNGAPPNEVSDLLHKLETLTTA
jgi:hypothetical protein